MSMHARRWVAIVLVVAGVVAGCKKDKPTEPPNDEEPTPHQMQR